MEREHAGDGGCIGVGDAVGAHQSLGGDGRHAGQDPRPEFGGDLGAHALTHTQQVRPQQQVTLQRDLGEGRDQCRPREILEPEIGSEGAGVADLAVRVGVLSDARARQRRGQRRADDRQVRVRNRRLGRWVDVDAPRAVRHPVRWGPWRAMDRPHDRVRGRRRGGGVEGGVLDRVAHAPHPLVAHRLHVHERAAVAEFEHRVVLVGDGDLEVHVLGRRADVDLQVLHDGDDGLSAEAHRLLHAQGVQRAGGRPLVDRDLFSTLAVDSMLIQQRDSDSVLQMTVQQPLPQEDRERVAVEIGELIDVRSCCQRSRTFRGS